MNINFVLNILMAFTGGLIRWIKIALTKDNIKKVRIMRGVGWSDFGGKCLHQIYFKESA